LTDKSSAVNTIPSVLLWWVVIFAASRAAHMCVF
jgi:hypothetical protein